MIYINEFWKSRRLVTFRKETVLERCDQAHVPQFLVTLYNAACVSLSRAHGLVLTIAKHDAEASIAAFLLEIDARAVGKGKSEFLSLPM